MRSVAWLSAMLVLAFMATASASAKTFRPKGVKLTLGLPATWHTTKPDPGWSFEAVAPHLAAFVFLSAKPALVNDTAFLGSFVTFQRQRSKSLGPHMIFRAKRTTIGSVEAIETIATGKNATDEYSYAFQNGGLEYTLVYATTSELLPKEKAAFEKSAASLRFLNAA
ncbi:MAG TPA: hypothetical protein VH063_10855 [Gaiellaceae bacterium]|jgi:hypothetical protein|nr:hypothetical protein [Gaiellaceae bacterium]